MILPTVRPAHWDIFEEHLDEAAFLWRRWEDALVASNFALDDVRVGPEARLLAHLDGLVLGGRRIAQELLLPTLVTDDPAQAFAATWALVQAEDGADYHDPVVDALVHGAPRLRAANARALSLAPRADLNRLAGLWPAASPSVRATLFDVLGFRDGNRVRPWLESSLRSDDPSLVTAALRSFRRSPDRLLIASVEDVLSSDDGSVRAAAIAAGVAIQSRPSWDACRAAAVEPGEGCRLPLGLLAMSPEKRDRAVVHAAAGDSALKRHAVWALGFAGDLDAAEALLEATNDESVARIAGESLSTMTGLALGRSMIQPGKTLGPNVEEVDLDDPPPVVRTDDQLAVPNAKNLKSWWARERNRFSAGVDHLHGRPRTPETVHAALGSATMWRREVLWTEWARATGVPSRVNLGAWSADQRRQLGEDSAAPARTR